MTFKFVNLYLDLGNKKGNRISHILQKLLNSNKFYAFYKL